MVLLSGTNSSIPSFVEKASTLYAVNLKSKFTYFKRLSIKVKI